MPWNDDSWKDGYDAWKLRAPDWDDDDPPDYEDGECGHESFDVDILTGRAECQMCPHSWYASAEEIQRQIDHEAAYAEYLERGERDHKLESFLQWWRDFWSSVKSLYRWRGF